jgi:hypothetical protein
MLNAHTGAIVIRNGRSVSLAECEWLSKAWKTSTVLKRSSREPIAIGVRVPAIRPSIGHCGNDGVDPRIPRFGGRAGAARVVAVS